MRKINEKPAPLGIRHGDTVKVMAGRSKGMTGKVLSVNPEKARVTVEHANIIKKHTRPIRRRIFGAAFSIKKARSTFPT